MYVIETPESGHGFGIKQRWLMYFSDLKNRTIGLIRKLRGSQPFYFSSSYHLEYFCFILSFLITFFNSITPSQFLLWPTSIRAYHRLRTTVLTLEKYFTNDSVQWKGEIKEMWYQRWLRSEQKSDPFERELK